ISPYNQECSELGVCFYDSEQENYRFFTWGEVSIENIIGLVSEKIKEYKVEKVIFNQPKKATAKVKENFASLSLMVNFQATSKEIVQEINSLLNKGIYSIANLERKEKEAGQKLIQENETPQPLEKEKTYEKQPPIVFSGKIVKCEVVTVKKGANEGSAFYSLLVEHDNNGLPQPIRIVGAERALVFHFGKKQAKNNYDFYRFWQSH
ncbi:33965_t:CDS:2, partial [Racocetra persica]